MIADRHTLKQKGKHIMKLFIYGYYTRNNFGDFLIAYSLFKLLRDHRPADYIFVYWIDPLVPEFLQEDSHVQVIKRPNDFKGFLSLLRTLLHVDAVIVGGGQKYKWSFKSGLAPQLIIPCFCKILGKRLLFLSVGIEPARDPLWIRLLKDLLNAADGVSVRDLSSFYYLKNIGIDCLLSSDLVFYYIMSCFEQLDSLKRSSKVEHKLVNKVGLAIRCSEISEDLLTYYFPNLITKLARNYTVILLPATPGDLILYKKILNTLPLDIRQKIIIEKNLDPVHIIKVISNLDAIISTRLHFLPFALALDIPIVGINYPEKVRAFCKELRTIIYDVRNIESLFNALTSVFHHSVNYSKALSENFNRVLSNVKLLEIDHLGNTNAFNSLFIRLKLIMWVLFIGITKFINSLHKLIKFGFFS